MRLVISIILGVGLALMVTIFWVAWFSISPSTTFLDLYINFLIEMPVLSSMCFDITSAMKQIKR